MQSSTYTPKVSVVIPNFNHAPFLKKRIESVLNQTYQDFEVIYLDDASSDNSNEIFEEFSDNPRIRSIFNQVNSGSPFKQWNKGVKEAKGEYVWIAESDDFADEKFLERLVEKLDDNPNAGLAYCQSWQVDKADQILSKHDYLNSVFNTNRWSHDFINEGIQECNQYLIFRNTIPNASAVLFRRSHYQKHGGAPEDMRLCGDWLYWAKILSTSKVIFVTEPLNYYRVIHSGSVRGNTGKVGLFLEERFRVIQYICQNVEIPEQRRLAALHEHIDYWLNFSASRLNEIPLSRHRLIYEIVRDLDVNINLMLIRKIPIISIKTMMKAVGITQRIKKVSV
jgi:glycosyltransferase involved in cell wall biosynthesis